MTWQLLLAALGVLSPLVAYMAYLVFCYAVYARRDDGDALARAGKIGRFHRK